jgi:DNA-binding response OmpR family regulator
MTNQTVPHILIVDDDESICKTLSAILQAEGYQTTTATTAKEAIEKAKTRFFNLALLDIKLPDMEGTQLLSQLQEITPETIKIMITGYPSLKNAVEALNFGADSYIMKPIDPAELIKTIKNKLEVQKQAEKITKEKLAAWIQSQARKAQTSNFQEFLEETAAELTHFGLTKTQAKIYITLLALGVASASEIAALSEIRREEIYRIIPEMEKHGIITRKLKTPRKFAATKPETAIQVLTKIKLKTMKEEIDKLKQKQAELVSRLKTTELPIERENCSVEVLSQRDSAFVKLRDMAKNAKNQIDIVTPLQNLTIIYVNRPRKLMEKVLKSVKMRILTEDCELDVFTKKILQFSEANDNPIELRQVEKLPFNLLIVDDKEAMRGETRPKNEDSPIFWTDDPTQISILKASFESLWQKSSNIRKL